MMELREISLPDFMLNIVGDNPSSYRDIRSLLAEKSSRLGLGISELRAKDFRKFGVVNCENISELTSYAFHQSLDAIQFGNEKRYNAELYFTPNGFSKASRYRLSKLDELCCVWVDLDIRNPSRDGDLFGTEINNVHHDLLERMDSDTTLPKPDLVVSTGSGGLHLYWTFTPEAADLKNLKLWRLLRNRLNTLLTHSSLAGRLYVDERGNDSPKRIMRLPDTLNIKHNRVCRAFVAEPKIERRSLNYLIEHLKVDATKSETRLQKRAFNPKLIKGNDFCNDNFNVYSKLNNHQKWCLRYVNFVAPLLMDGIKVNKGYRDLVSFSVVVCLRQLGCPKGLVRQIIIEMNQASIGLPTNVLLDYMSSAMTKRYRAKSNEFLSSFTCGTGIDSGHLNPKRKRTKRTRAEHARLVAAKKKLDSISLVAFALSRKLSLVDSLRSLRLNSIANEAGLTVATLRNIGLNKKSLWGWIAAVQFNDRYHSSANKELYWRIPLLSERSSLYSVKNGES